MKQNSFVSLSDLPFDYLLVEIYGDSITIGIYIVKCDGNVHVERLVGL